MRPAGYVTRGGEVKPVGKSHLEDRVVDGRITIFGVRSCDGITWLRRGTSGVLV